MNGCVDIWAELLQPFPCSAFWSASRASFCKCLKKPVICGLANMRPSKNSTVDAECDEYLCHAHLARMCLEALCRHLVAKLLFILPRCKLTALDLALATMLTWLASLAVWHGVGARQCLAIAPCCLEQGLLFHSATPGSCSESPSSSQQLQLLLASSPAPDWIVFD